MADAMLSSVFLRALCGDPAARTPGFGVAPRCGAAWGAGRLRDLFHLALQAELMLQALQPPWLHPPPASVPQSGPQPCSKVSRNRSI